MDIEKTVNFVSSTASEYLAALFSTFTTPGTHFEPIYEKKDSIVGSTQVSPRLHPRLLVYTFLNLVAGLLLRSLIVATEPAYGLFLGLEIVVIFFWWVIFATLVHGLCVLAHGKVPYVGTMSVVLQLTSTMYFFSAFVTLLFGSLLKRTALYAGAGQSLQFIIWISEASAVLTILLIAVYLPLHLRQLYKFTLRRSIIVMLGAVAVAVVMFVLISLAGPPVGRQLFKK
jgi:hypothetical protein